jgi:hypothetical protein
MIWLLPHPLFLSPVTKWDRRHTRRLGKRNKLLPGEVEGGRSHIMILQESLVLYKSFNIL